MTFEDIQGTADIDTGDGSGSVNGRLAGLRLRTGDGTLTVRLDEGSAMTDDWELRTGDGNIRLEVPEGFAANLDASTGDGRVHLEGFGDEGAGGPGEEVAQFHEAAARRRREAAAGPKRQRGHLDSEALTAEL